ncbi:50S ribosomal protein L29 [Candidatus Phytoplasma mali]|uniref:Large ribosomal subunit protein uL29 n=1 Tax=Phytoplasma mali (strain AT) TaxID=482235 RepID=B3QZZ9_PHYMT|nr:50S ribosomal protein L29 [Candidatus Phytoplasma mali]CAP18536.1 50S ribosomal protein L29 [Candidatus Phytoplasma mali]
MKIQQFRKMNIKELQDNLINFKEEFFRLRFKLSLGQLTNTSQINKVKKNIARVKTVITDNFLSKKNFSKLENSNFKDTEENKKEKIILEKSIKSL